MPRTLFDKIWEQHLVAPPAGRYGASGSPALLYVDLHLVHEVTSPQAFESLRLERRRVRRPDRTFATMDHDVPTDPRGGGPLRVLDELARTQLDTLRANCQEFGIELFDVERPEQGIVHVIGPELGLTQPGRTIVCGDSHTSTHGALGALAFGIGTSEVEHVLATQCLWQSRPKTLELRIEGRLPAGVTAKDLILHIIGRIGTGGAAGHVIEYTGAAIRALSMEQRMTVCNMSIEAGARAGMISPDPATIAYLRGRRFAPAPAQFENAAADWLALASEPGASYDASRVFDAAEITPQVTWGTNPAMVAPISGRVPDPAAMTDAAQRRAAELALAYMGLEPGVRIAAIPLDRVFIGSCTNARLEDLQAAARIVRGHKASPRVRAMVVPGSRQVKAAAERLGLDRIFLEAGFEWREPGCSMCLGMNPDTLLPGERCASTSNRNFEGRQGAGGRTHLVSPEMAAAAAIAGHFVDVREWPLAEAGAPAGGGR